MKRIVVAAIALGSLLFVLVPAHATDPLQAGFDVRSIVPAPELMDEVYSVVGGKHPTMVLDPIEARAVAISEGGRELILVSLDLLGFFYDDIVLVRDAVRAELGPSVEVIVASTHSHSSIDTLGIYGPDEVTTGINDAYQAFVREQAAAAALGAHGAREPVTMRVGRLEAPSGYNEFDRNRHPGSFDDGVTAIRFETDTGVKGTLVNWASHPELIDPDSSSDPAFPPGNVVISSDYVHTLRTTVEQDGGTAVFVNGPIGAVTALAMPFIDPDTGQPFPRRSVAKARHLGTVIGQTARDALDDAPALTAPALAITSYMFELPVDNPFILAIRAGGAIKRQLYLYGVGVPFGRDVRTEMFSVHLGPIQFLTTPGEMQPDLYTGVYLPEDERANPDVPPEQPIRQQMTGRFRFIVGLGQDELGYFVSATDYTWPSFYPIYGEGVDRNGVEHYQETLSLGRDTARRLSNVVSLLLFTPPEGGYFAHPGGFLGANGEALYDITSAARGIWIDSSDSGRYERGEDAAIMLAGPNAGAYGYLDSQARDIGTTLTEQARGVWIDSNDDGELDPADASLFFDSYAFGEGEPQP